MKIYFEMLLKYAISFFVVMLLLGGCTGGGAYSLRSDKGKKQNLKILLAKNMESVEFSINGPFKIDSTAVFSVGPKSFRAKIKNNSIVIEDKVYGSRVNIASDNHRFHLSKSEFRGDLLLYVESGKLNAVENFTMEEYLYGVVGREMSGSSPIEALKAQAVAARTFGYYEKSIRKTNEYDIDNLIQSQAYIGTESENQYSIEAVDLTCGEVMKYKGDVIFAAFAANCGGYTENNKEVFGYSLPYLQAVPCTFCRKYEHASWQEEIETTYIVSSLKKKGLDVTIISGIDIIDTSKAGRVKTISIATDKGRINMSINEFRLAVGSEKFKSARFSVRTKGNTLLFKGRGWGHGVGMCQDGADGMAKLGNNYRRILTRYYCGIEIGQK
ncbi:MAG: SpoIID/LytB domain-containing protein [Candidatus Firestonebacteria bacterium]|nr:SpoIID/LytB domain-containing protein [Candidatus Firestonebacteria bacterium]